MQALFGQPVGRNRAGEFAARRTRQRVVAARRATLRAELSLRLASLPTVALDATYEHPRRGSVIGREVLILVARHAAGLLGQAELTRELVHTGRLG